MCLLSLIMSADIQAAVYEEMQICWKAPTHRENGNELDQSEIIRYDLAYDIVADTFDEFWLWTVTPDIKCIAFLPTTPDEVCFVGTTTATNNLDPALELTSGLANRICRFPVEIEQASDPKPPLLFIP